ncbi:hypothetical protein [Mycobacterium leprae]|uniref:Uncharacterized protein MLCB4.33 n=1 Tax=Mycobacterium leprae TaxID=1769 RepID=O32926_MYCLR|nr:hypothetical protein [Mycobacterium leprae]OAR20059.1 hypothetical protein A8144_12435 [Mycobacterium leprae 3125609]CAA15482.1 hypothetical protein MLCBB1788.50 [Mycobacterium leprae]CAA18954.1 hypothetical protein MLCB4.33 [Mycobacterium leprae]
MLTPLGLQLSTAKTKTAHFGNWYGLSRLPHRVDTQEGNDHVGMSRTCIADRARRSVKAKIRALANRKSQRNPGAVLAQINHRWFRALYRRRWKDIRRQFTTSEKR